MSEKLHNFDDSDPIGTPRLRPAVVFGLRAAALAGVALSVGVSEAAASGLFDNADAITAFPDTTGTTCCPDNS